MNMQEPRAATTNIKAPRGWVWVPPGRFWMGAPEGEPGQGDDERLHEVELTRGFLVCIHPVTQEEWEAVMGSNPSRYKGARRPVEHVSWDDAIQYCNARSTREGLPAYYQLDGRR